MTNLQQSIANANDDLDPYREKLERQLEPYVAAWENAKTVAGVRSGSENSGESEKGDNGAVHFLWPQPVVDNATTGTELMT